MSEPEKTQIARLIRADAPPQQRADDVSAGLPPHLLRQSSKRLQVVALVLLGLISFGWLGGNWIEGELAHELTTPVEWVPNVVILAASFLVLWVARFSRAAPATVLTVGLVFQVVVSWCIPISQYWNAFAGMRGEQINGDLVGGSTVALWMIFFTVIVPTRPRYALVALALSGLSVPATIGFLIRVGNMPPVLPVDFVLIFVTPYLTVLLLAYISARIVYGMGREVQQATEMGSYRLLKLIGKGGMGEVWLAEHNLLARPAAVKLIHSDALRPRQESLETVLKRFEREAQVTASLESPHTVALYDFGVSESGSLYYAMEHLSGMDLETLVEQFGPLPPERVIHVLDQVCASLGEAHRRGLVHRDIKPANIFLCECAFERDFVKILDFGLVKRTAVVGDADASLATGHQIIAGTPSYLAPELAAGRHDIDGRVDIYSLGCVAFWLLTGRRPFEEDTPVAMIVAHASSDPSPPSRFAASEIPLELDALVLECLAKQPVDRPATAEIIATRLRGIQIPERWTSQRAIAWWETMVAARVSGDSQLEAGH